MAEVLVEMALGSSEPRRILDPTCGGGAFLLAALDALVSRGLDPTDALSRVRGSDSDAGAVDASRRSLAAWADQHGATGLDPATAVHRLDALTGCAWEDPPDLIVGNPPFASPLRTGAHNPAAVAYRAANGDLLGPYADLAGLHLHRAMGMSAEGATVCLILPQSTLASRDLAALREHLAETAPVTGVWATGERVFDAGVRVWAPVLVKGAPPTNRRWSDLVADALGVPPSILGEGGPTLADLATATAGFRDEYYGLKGACREVVDSGSLARLVTVGSIDPLSCGWGETPIRFGSRRWMAPVVELDELDPKVRRWTEDRLRPKVLVPTQTRILEPYVDREGICVPSTPLVAVHAEPQDLDRVAAVLLAPPVVVWAYRRSFGSALSGDALKLAARDLLDIPLPPDDSLWGEAARAVGRDDPLGAAEIMNRAYGGTRSVLDWWRKRSAFGAAD